MNRPDEAIRNLEEFGTPSFCSCDDCERRAATEVLLYIRELEADNKEAHENSYFWQEKCAEKLATNKRIEQETAFKCAYLAWQASLASQLAAYKDNPRYKPERMICDQYELNHDSLYSTTWKELNK